MRDARREEGAVGRGRRAHHGVGEDHDLHSGDRTPVGGDRPPLKGDLAGPEIAAGCGSQPSLQSEFARGGALLGRSLAADQFESESVDLFVSFGLKPLLYETVESEPEETLPGREPERAIAGIGAHGANLAELWGNREIDRELAEAVDARDSRRGRDPRAAEGVALREAGRSEFELGAREVAVLVDPLHRPRARSQPVSVDRLDAICALEQPALVGRNVRSAALHETASFGELLHAHFADDHNPARRRSERGGPTTRLHGDRSDGFELIGIEQIQSVETLVAEYPQTPR